MLDPLQPLARRFARLGEGVDGGEVGMRRELPGAGDEAACLPALALGGKQPSGDLCRRYQRGRKPQRFGGKRQRLVRLRGFKIARFGGEQHGAAPERHVRLDIAMLARHGERGESAFPIALARLHVEQRVHAPAGVRIGAHRLLGKGAGGVVVVAALGLEEQSAQSQELGLRAVEHRLEGAPRRGAVALELGCLRLEQSGEWLVGKIAARHACIALRLGPVADADGEKPAGQRIEALAAAALLPIGGDGGRPWKRDSAAAPRQGSARSQERQDASAPTKALVLIS